MHKKSRVSVTVRGYAIQNWRLAPQKASLCWSWERQTMLRNKARLDPSAPCITATGSFSVSKRYTCCQWLASVYRPFLCAVFWVVLAIYMYANTRYSNTRVYAQWKMTTTMILQSCSSLISSYHIFVQRISWQIAIITRRKHFTVNRSLCPK